MPILRGIGGVMGAGGGRNVARTQARRPPAGALGVGLAFGVATLGSSATQSIS